MPHSPDATPRPSDAHLSVQRQSPHSHFAGETGPKHPGGYATQPVINETTTWRVVVGWLLAAVGTGLLIFGGLLAATTDGAGMPLHFLPGYVWILVGLGVMSGGLLLAGIPWN